MKNNKEYLLPSVHERLERMGKLHDDKLESDKAVDLSRFSAMTETEVFSLTAEDCTSEEILYFKDHTPQLDDLDELIVELYFLGELTYEEIADIANYDKQTIFRRRDKLTLKIHCTIWRLSHPGKSISSVTILKDISEKVLKHRRRHKKTFK